MRSIRIAAAASLAGVWLAALGISAQAQSVQVVAPTRTISVERLESLREAPVISALALDPTGRRLAAVGDDHSLRLWDVDGASPNRRWIAHEDWPRAVVFRPDGRMIATAGHDRRVRFWVLTTSEETEPGRPEPAATVTPDPTQAILALAYSPDGRLLAAGGSGGKVFVLDGETGRTIRELDAPGADVRTLDFSPGGDALAAAGRGGRIRVWDAEGNPLWDMEGSGRLVRAIGFSPGGDFLAAAGDHPTVQLWSIGAGQAAGEVPSRVGRVFALRFCGDGLLAVGGSGNDISVCNLADSQERYRLRGHTGTVAAMAYRAEDGTLVSGGFDTTIRFWQLDAADRLPVARGTAAAPTR
jgi:WD40 repeat protein